MENKVHNFTLNLDWNLLRIVSKIDRFDASWTTIEKKEQQSLKQLKNIATVRSVGASTRIEGSKMSNEEVKVLLDKIDITKIEDRDAQEVVGYFEVMDLLFSKYIKAEITYEGIHRIETYEYPKEAIREALLNAIIHKDYSGNTPIQISVYKEKIMFWNDGQLPENWTVEKLSQKHASKPYNPDIANAVFRCGYIESWGRGTIKIIEKCVEAGLPKPSYKYETSGLWVIFNKDIYTSEYLNSLDLNDRQITAVFYTKENGKITNSDYQKINDCSRNTASNDLSELVEKELINPSGQKGAGAFYSLN